MPYPANYDPALDDVPVGGEQSHRAVSSELRSIVERVENLEARKKEVQDDIKDVYSEAKGRGYDSKVIRKLIADRKKAREEVAEFEAVLHLYRDALEGL